MVKKKLIKKKVKIDSANAKSEKKIPTLGLKEENDIARDFAVKVYKKFDKLIKSVILFGSSTKQEKVLGSDIDIVILIDDASVKWDQELIVWYREELDKLIRANPYRTSLHINTIKLTTWWNDFIRGDPLILNILRDGEAMLDIAGFFNPLKHLLIEGKIKATPEAIYSCLQRAPIHIARSKAATLSSIEGLFWSMVDSAHAALIAANASPESPEHIPRDLKQIFIDSGKLKPKYVEWYKELLVLHKEINHNRVTALRGVEIDEWQSKAEEFLNMMAKLVKDLVEN